MATTLLPPDFKEFLRLLNFHSVKYLLVGGYAVGYYGYPRATADMDIWVGIEPANIEKVVQTLAAFGFADVSAEVFSQEDRVIRMGVPPLRIELITGASGVTFDECYEKRTVAVLDGLEVNLIGLDHLKQNKKASGRHKDLNDLEHLP